MASWSQIIQDSFLNGTKPSKDVVTTSDNIAFLQEYLEKIALVKQGVDTLANSVRQTYESYAVAIGGNVLDINALKVLNSDSDVRNKLIKDSFTKTLNDLSLLEIESEEEKKLRLSERFSI